MNTQSKFDIALARAEQRARETDWDQHLVQEGDDIIVIEESQIMTDWQRDQIIYTVTGKLCIDQDSAPSFAFIHDAWFIDQAELPY